MAVSPGSRCCEQVIQPELESGVGHDLYEGHTQPRVQAPDALPAEHTSGCIQHSIVYLYGEVSAVTVSLIVQMLPHMLQNQGHQI